MTELNMTQQHEEDFNERQIFNYQEIRPKVKNDLSALIQELKKKKGKLANSDDSPGRREIETKPSDLYRKYSEPD